MFQWIKVFFVDHWNCFNPVYLKTGWHFRISFRKKDNNETWLCRFVAGIFSDSRFLEFIDSSKRTVGKSLLIAFVLK